MKNSQVNGPMRLEAAVEIKFDCLQPVRKIFKEDKGVYSFGDEKPKYRRRKLEFNALVEFLNIPRLSFSSQKKEL